MSRYTLRDRAWLRRSFAVSKDALADADVAQRAMTTASLKFTDTSMGGNFCINPPPQFTRYADINASRGSSIAWSPSLGDYIQVDPEAHVNKASRMAASFGMGRRYSEVIDDNGQVLTMRFGVPKYNSWTRFFGNFYDPTASLLARTGRGPGLLLSLGTAIGMGLALPWQPIIWFGRAWKRLNNIPASKFYYLKPTMALYWDAVSTIVNGIGLNMGITPRNTTQSQKDVLENDENRFTEDDLKRYHEMLPDVIGADGTINVRGIANRAQRLANMYNVRVREKLDRYQAQWGAQRSNDSALQKVFEEIQNELLSNKSVLADPGASSNMAYILTYLEMEQNKPERNSDGSINTDGVEAFKAAGQETSAPPPADSTAVDPPPPAPEGEEGEAPAAPAGAINTDAGKDEIVTKGIYGSDGSKGPEEPAGPSLWEKGVSWAKTFWDFHQAEARDGADWVSFRVDYNATVSESFSNSTQPHQLAGQINAASNQARMSRINMADGNIGSGLISGSISTVIDTAKNLANSVLAGFQLSGLAAVAGNAFVDVPNVYGDSTANLPRIDCSMQLRTPYGNKLSLLRNIWVPFSCILAGTLPISHGMHAYGSPFLVEAYMQGRAAIRLGIIDNLSVTRGVGNVGWNQERMPLGVDISFSIVDMSTILHMPITANMGGLGTKGIMALGTAADWFFQNGVGTDVASFVAPATYDEDSSFTDYLAVLGSLALPDMIYGTRRWHLNRLRTIRNWKDSISPERAAQHFIYGTTPGRIINALSRSSDRFR